MAVYWTLPNTILPTTGPTASTNGIGIAGNASYPTFQTDVQNALAQIATFSTGNLLLQSIINKIPSKRVAIKPPRTSAGSNECQNLGGANGADDARTLLTVDIGGGQLHSIVTRLQIALNQAGHPNDYALLVNLIRRTPIYKISGPPATAPSNLPIMSDDIRDWFRAMNPYPLPLTGSDAQNLNNIISIAVDSLGQQIPGSGANTIVYWNPTGNSITLTDGTVQTRPPYIGLAHELVHAYYNMSGLQLSNSEDPTHYSTVLYEYMAVGLGYWVIAPFSENTIRVQARLAKRTMY